MYAFVLGKKKNKTKKNVALLKHVQWSVFQPSLTESQKRLSYNKKNVVFIERAMGSFKTLFVNEMYKIVPWEIQSAQSHNASIGAKSAVKQNSALCGLHCKNWPELSSRGEDRGNLPTNQSATSSHWSGRAIGQPVHSSHFHSGTHPKTRLNWSPIYSFPFSVFKIVLSHVFCGKNSHSIFVQNTFHFDLIDLNLCKIYKQNHVSKFCPHMKPSL